MIAGFKPPGKSRGTIPPPLPYHFTGGVVGHPLGGTMRGPRLITVSAIVLIFLSAILATARPAADENKTIVIIFKDGHRQSLTVAQIARLDFKSPSVIVYKDGHQE